MKDAVHVTSHAKLGLMQRLRLLVHGELVSYAVVETEHEVGATRTLESYFSVRNIFPRRQRGEGIVEEPQEGTDGRR